MVKLSDKNHLLLAYLQVLSDSGTARTAPLKWPEERGETALRSTSLSTGNDKQARKGVARGGGAGTTSVRNQLSEVLWCLSIQVSVQEN